MKLSLFIAFRYFFSKKKKNFINVISLISMVVVAIGTMSLVVALSVFNGLEDLFRTMYSSFDPDIIITPAKGKSTLLNPEKIQQISTLDGVMGLSKIVEDNVLIKYKQSQRVVKMKGVDPEFEKLSGMREVVVSGNFRLRSDSTPSALVGRGVQYDLSLNLEDPFNTLQIYYPNEIRPGVINPERMTRLKNIMPSGAFAFEKYYDENYVIVPISFAQELLGYGEKVTSVEVFLKSSDELRQIKSSINDILGKKYLVKAGEELHDDLYKVLQIEKIFAFLILLSIITIASINIFFALTMLVIEKRKDISSLVALGADRSLIRSIFLTEGLIISLSGAIAGLLLGLVLVFLQDKFGLVGLGMETSVISSYPVKVLAVDVLIIAIAMILVTLLASIQPAVKAGRSFATGHLHS